MLLTSQWIVKMNFWASMNAGMRGNMKRKIAWILLAAMTLSIAACGNKTGDSVADDGNITAEATEGALDTSANLEGSCADILDDEKDKNIMWCVGSALCRDDAGKRAKCAEIQCRQKVQNCSVYGFTYSMGKSEF